MCDKVAVPDDRGPGGQDHHQQVAILALGGEHGRLCADLAPVAAGAPHHRAGQHQPARVAPHLNTDAHHSWSSIYMYLAAAVVSLLPDASLLCR